MTAERYAGRTCPDCGPVSVRADRFTRLHTATGSREKWACPKCGKEFSSSTYVQTDRPSEPLDEDYEITFGRALEACPDAAELTLPQPAEETSQ